MCAWSPLMYSGLDLYTCPSLLMSVSTPCAWPLNLVWIDFHRLILRRVILAILVKNIYQYNTLIRRYINILLLE